MNNSNDKFLPIKIVLPKASDDKKKMGGGGPRKCFSEVDNEYRINITTQVESLIDIQQTEFPSAIAKIIMKKGAEAKSHKPNNFVKKLGLSVIGTNKLNEVIIGFSKTDLANKKVKILHDISKDFVANLSAIESLELYNEGDKFAQFNKDDLITYLNTNKKGEIKITLFNFGLDHVKQYLNYLKSLNIRNEYRVVNYSETLSAIIINNNNDLDVSKIDEITKHFLVKSVSVLPVYETITSGLGTLDKHNLKLGDISPLTNTEYPVVGIIDSGISDDNKYLKDWIYDREVFVPLDLQDNSHGTAVASTIQYGNELNNIISSNTQRFKFLDVVAIGDRISEDDLMDIIYKVVSKHHSIVKIWNMSINSINGICSDYSLSDFAMFIDDVQTEFEVQFVISAGNYNTPRQWPPVKDHNNSDRVTSPAESVIGLAVGSVSQKESPKSIVNINEPSPFTRKGPGAIYIQKPELVDYGGNYDTSGSHINLGVKVMDTRGNTIEMIGTSFSAPRVTKKLTEIYYSIANKSLVMAKTLLLHSTKMSGVSYNGDLEVFKYIGFGMPNQDTSQILSCTPHKMTMAFEYTLENGRILELLDFPFPDSLIRDGKCYADINMTLGYIPPLDAQFGQEYCRSNIGVTLGTYEQEVDFETGEIKQVRNSYKGRVPIEKKWDEKNEKVQVENGFKWNPLKTYFGKLRGIKSDTWKLKVDVLSRNDEELENQKFYLIVTIEDYKQEHDIYSEIVNKLRTYGYVTNDLLVENIIKISN